MLICLQQAKKAQYFINERSVSSQSRLFKPTILMIRFNCISFVIFIFLQETKLDSYIQTTLEAIEYYQTYFKYELFTAFSLSMLGWILIVIGHVMNIQSMYKEITRAFKFKTLLILCAIYGYNFRE